MLSVGRPLFRSIVDRALDESDLEPQHRERVREAARVVDVTTWGRSEQFLGYDVDPLRERFCRCPLSAAGVWNETLERRGRAPENNDYLASFYTHYDEAMTGLLGRHDFRALKVVDL